MPKQGQVVSGGIAGWTGRVVNSEIMRDSHSVGVVNTSLIGSRAKGARRISILSEIYRTANILISTLNKGMFGNYDIAHLNSNCSSYGLLRDNCVSAIVKMLRIPLIVHMRCDVAYYKYSSLAYWALKLLLNRADMIFALNQSSMDFISAKTGKPSVYMPLFIQDSKCSENLNKKIAEKASRICFVGHVSEQKGCNLINEIANNFPEITFALVGHVFESYDREQAPPNIKLIGEVSSEAVQSIMQESDLFLFPSYTEGFPNAVLEAMACGLPIIASSVGAIPDMVGTNQEGGILVRTREMQDYVDAINKLSNDPQKRYQMSKRNYEEVVRSYSESIVINGMLEEYGECIARKR